jgi:hypothetical protein
LTYLCPTPLPCQHERQLDPTQIIAIPYDLQRLYIYVLAVLVGTLFIYVQSFRMHIYDKIQRTLHLSVIFFLVFLLCGASVYDHLLHTYLAALYVVALSWFDPPIFYHTSMVDTVSWSRRTSGRSSTGSSLMYPLYFDVILQQLRGPPPLVTGTASVEVRQQFILSQTIVYCCWIGTIPAQILLLYDRGYQIQRYPIPVILGCTIGWTIGILFGTVRAFSRDDRPPE